MRGGQPNPNARQQVADLRRGNITIELFQLADAAPLPEARKNPSEHRPDVVLYLQNRQ